ncbi:MAG: hypothetical protein ACFFC3_02130 [Candidatus Odinarchaeota archaeon]
MEKNSGDLNKIEGNEKKKSKLIKLKRVFLYFRSFAPLLLSHHPECERFKNHTLNIKRIRLCIGCFVGYPTALISILIIGAFKLNRLISPKYLLIFGIIFLTSFVLSPLNLTKIKFIKVIQKFLIGLGSALIFWGIWSLPNSYLTNFTISFTVFLIIFLILNVYHTYSFYRICINCKTPFDWSKCSGLSSIRQNLKKYSLTNIFDAFDEIHKRILIKREKKK